MKAECEPNHAIRFPFCLRPSYFADGAAPTLDELKELIDRFPRIFDVDVCEDRWLPYLANLVGMPFDGTADPTAQRRLIKEAVPNYQHKATIPAIRRSLTDIGRSGELEETFRRALRLNSRSRARKDHQTVRTTEGLLQQCGHRGP